MRKVIPVIKYIFFPLVFLGGSGLSIAQNAEIISAEEYEVINTVLSENHNRTIYIYDRLFYDKGWADYFDPANFKSITSKVGIPVTISDTELRNILTDEVLNSINNSINSSKPVKLKKEKLNKSIGLTNSFDEPGDLKKGVQRISKPIIIGDIAVFRKIGFTEAPIYILKKENETWNIIYTFYDWMILE